MKTNEPLAWLTSLTILLVPLSLAAQETAVVKDGRINVRGQPSLVGEVITQLQKGEKVVILEEVANPRPKTNEPPKWARIQMPQNTPVWVYAPFLELANKTVKVTRLNLRAGPGENYSVVGRLEKGASVNEIRRVEDWMEIETPPGAYGFVAADLLTKLDANARTLAALLNHEPTLAPAPAAPSVTPTPAPPKSEPPKAQPRKPELLELQPLKSAPPKEQQSQTQLAGAPAPSGLAAPGASNPSAAEMTPRRVVRREGLVRSTVSIQSPTYYELLSPENRKTINYLHAENIDVNLKDYRGRTVVVTGEEAIDPRWPKTPVIEVEKLELIP